MENVTIDIVVFAIIILLSFAVTVYKNLSNSKEKTKNEYVLANESAASTWPMLMSIARGFLGVRVFLGYPSELFYRGSELWETMYGIVLAFPLVIFIFIPVYLRLGITSVYEYLDLRFKSKLIRCMASATYVVRTLLILGVATLTPCIAIKTVIGVPYYASIIVMIIAAIFCVFSGGFSSALMGDVIQGILMFTCCIVVIIKGSIENGPINIIKTAHDRDRLNFFNFDLDPTKRATTISALIGHLFISLSMYGCQQNYVQRYISMATEEKVKRVLLLSIPFNAAMMSLTWIVGMVIFSTYADCDPKKIDLINDIDEIFPFYLEDKFSILPGFLGIILGTLFNGSLSAIVSNLNSLATVLWEDFLANIQYFKQVSDVKAVRIIKTLGALCGLIVMAVSFGIAHLNGIIEVFIIMTSATSGPLLGVFIIAVFFPSVNWKGALAGMIAGSAVVSWIILGSLSLPRVQDVQDQYLPTSTLMCDNYTFSEVIMQRRNVSSNTNPLMSTMRENISNGMKPDPPILNGTQLDSPISNDTKQNSTAQFNADSSEHIFTQLYKVTYLYYSVIGTTATVLIGFLFSIVNGFQAEEYLYKDNLIHPLIVKRRPYHGAALSFEIK